MEDTYYSLPILVVVAVLANILAVSDKFSRCFNVKCFDTLHIGWLTSLLINVVHNLEILSPASRTVVSYSIDGK